MNGQALIDQITSILGGEQPNPVYLLQLINLSKDKIEMGINPAKPETAGSRPWKVLSVNNHALTVTGSNRYTASFALPADFLRYLGESTLFQGSIVLFDGNNNIQYLKEIPIENVLYYKDQFGFFAVDYANNLFYIMGIVPGTFTIYQYYIKTTDPITLVTTWQNFPSRYHAILAFDTAARWRLGTDYDDVAARNADDNVKMVDGLFHAMESWDTELAISAVNGIDYGDIYGNSGNNNYPGPRGVRAY